MNKIKALVLLSGGLDSMLAVKVLQVQGIEVVGLCFKSNFYGCSKAREAVAQLGIELIEFDLTEAMLTLVKNPPSGYGKNLNPCIDCHALMISKAGEIAKEKGFDFIATGEVLGQRPFSQTKDSLNRVAKLAGVPVLRPLSAKLLSETEIEKQGLVRRGRLLDLSGRGRERQLELAEKFKIEEYPSPAGGCLLTDPGFSERGMLLLDNWPSCDSADFELIKHGRVFWFTNLKGEKIVLLVGRHKEDNENLEKLAQTGDIVIKLKEITGPTSILRAKNSKFDVDSEILLNVPEKLSEFEKDVFKENSEEEILRLASVLTAYYASRARGREVKIDYLEIK
jgi:hypothetical protein